MKGSQFFGIIGGIGTVSGIIALVWTYLSNRDVDLSRKIISAQNIVQHCGLEEKELSRIMTILLQAEQKLNIEHRYSESANLMNSINTELLICNPKLEISEPMLMVWTIMGMMLIMFALLAIGKLKIG